MSRNTARPSPPRRRGRTTTQRARHLELVTDQWLTEQGARGAVVQLGQHRRVVPVTNVQHLWWPPDPIDRA
jgi:hypothetical protein